MSYHYRLALRYAALMTTVVVLVGAAVWLRSGAGYAVALYYGAGVGLISFVSTALTASMLAARSRAWQAGAALSCIARYGFALVALGVPAYLGSWSVLTMLGGFAAIYLAENVLLLPGMLGAIGGKDEGRSANERRKKIEWRTKA